MKKVIFSAIALLAFTATSFAAEGKKEVKKSEVKTEVKSEVKEELFVVQGNPCTRAFFSQLGFYMTCGATYAAAFELAGEGYQRCCDIEQSLQ